MKRSTRVSLFLMGSVVVSGCDDSSKTVGIFSSISDCVESGIYTKEQCKTALEHAQEEHKALAPKYNSREDCEADFGRDKCEVPSPFTDEMSSLGSGSFWVPMMMGYLVGHTLNTLKSSSSFGQPLYYSNIPSRNRSWRRSSAGWNNTPNSGSWHTVDNTEVSRKKGLTMVNSDTLRSISPITTTILRGGFGARAGYVGFNSGG